MAVIGYVVVVRIERVKVASVWNKHGKALAVSPDELVLYLRGLEEAVVIEVGEPQRASTVVPLNALQAELRVGAPQGWRYLAEAEATKLENMLRAPGVPSAATLRHDARPLYRPRGLLASPQT
jgi:hypothetical protein